MSLAAIEQREQGTGRTLKTAVAVLQVLRMVEGSGEGVTPEEAAAALNKSSATASYLLNSLRQEGYAYQDSTTGRYLATSSRRVDPDRLVSPARAGERSACPPHGAGSVSALPPDRLRDAVHELYGLTRHRSYLATTDPDRDAIVVEEMAGHQGLPTVPGLQPTIRGEAHALALGKVLLAQRADAPDAYVDAHGLTAFTPRTIVRRDDLADELAVVRRIGYAVDREEFAEGCWCLAVPLYDAEGKASVALGISLSRGQIGEGQRRALGALYRVAREAESEEEVSG